MKIRFLCMGAVILAATSGQVHAAFVTIADFSGGETVATLNAVDFATTGLVFTSDDGLTVQNGGSLFGNISGASGSQTLNTGEIGNFSVTFSTPVNRAGLLLSSGSPTAFTWSISAYGAGSVLLETVSVSQPANPLPGVPQAVFGGIERTENIVKLVVQRTSPNPARSFTFFDDIRYEAVAPVPEPASLAMWGLGAVGMMFARRKRKQETLSV